MSSSSSSDSSFFFSSFLDAAGAAAAAGASPAPPAAGAAPTPDPTLVMRSLTLTPRENQIKQLKLVIVHEIAHINWNTKVRLLSLKNLPSKALAKRPGQ